jgi:hypothetical protein
MCSFRIISARNVNLDVPVYFSKAKHEHTVRKMKKKMYVGTVYTDKQISPTTHLWGLRGGEDV